MIQPDPLKTIELLLGRARYLTLTPAGNDPIEAIHLCFQILTLIPEHRETKDLIYHAICDPWLVGRIQQTINHQVPEWDDRPWQQQHRLALSYRLITRWPGFLREHRPGYETERDGPAEVRHLLIKGQRKLSSPNHPTANEKAWPLFAQAVEQSHKPQQTILWIAKCLAREAYFKESADFLTTYLSQFPDPNNDVRLLEVEVRWWRDNQYRIPWLPTVSGDGGYYYRLVGYVAAGDSNAFDNGLADQSTIALAQSDNQSLLLDENDLSQLPEWVKEIITHHEQAEQQG